MGYGEEADRERDEKDPGWRNPKRSTPREYMKEKFTPETIAEVERLYEKAKIVGADEGFQDLNKKVTELEDLMCFDVDTMPEATLRSICKEVKSILFPKRGGEEK